MSSAKLILDIETVGEDFDSLDKATQDVLTYWIKKEAESEEEYRVSLEELKNRLGFSPLTAEIVALGVLDYHKDEGVVYFQAPAEKIGETALRQASASAKAAADKQGGGEITFKQETEEEMLRKFWEGAQKYQHFITFNGRQFDVPFLMIRSAIHGVRPTKDLMQGRYLYQQRNSNAIHIDLFDQLTFYGALRRKGGLHLWSRAFGIKSPKGEGITGDDVGKLYAEKKYLEIAKYNVGDLRATRDLYERWENYLNL